MKVKYILISIVFLCISCGEDYLEKKPNKSLVIPKTLTDFQALLDNAQQVMNVVPAIGMIASDESFVEDAVLNSLYTATERNSYVWAANVYEGEEVTDWNVMYQQVFYANVVLDGLKDVPVHAANETQWKTVKGTALFTRAHAFYQLLEIFAPPYDNASSTTLPGIPIRLSADINVPVTRASQAESYAQVIADLEESADLLPSVTVSKTRPVVATAYGLLAKIYLNMNDHENAEAFASKALEENDYILDYNELDAASYAPIPFMNEEITYYANLITYGYVVSFSTFVDNDLLGRYAEGDLRKDIFFLKLDDDRYVFKGSYTASWPVFGGIANDEIILIRSECRARRSDVDGALSDLNTLLSKRWKPELFSPVSETSADALLEIILDERQKELVFRNTRWSDLRRLNKDSRFAVTLERVAHGITHSLPPNDLRYAFPIPDAEVRNSGIPQNPR